MKRSLFVPLFILGVLFPGYFYVSSRLTNEVWGWVAVAIPFLLIASLPLRFRSMEKEKTPSLLNEVLFHGTFLSMGILTYLFVFTILRDLMWIGAKWSGFPAASGTVTEFLSSGWVVGLTAVALFLGTLKAAVGMKVKKVRVPIENLPNEFDGLRIVQISDLHVGPTIRRQYVENVVRRTNDANPHIVALTGDIADGHLADLKEHISPLKDLTASLGVFYVPGNHEFYWNIADWTGMMRELGARVLWNEGHQIEFQGSYIHVGGITDPVAAHLGEKHKPDPQAAFQNAHGTQLKILLSHRPGFAKEAARVGFDLQLSGHTHGGQFFPWTLVVRMVHEYFLGLEQVERKMWIYVSGGTGSWGPHLRLGTTPELTVLELFRSRIP